MKILATLFLCLCLSSAFAQELKPETILTTPEGWRSEIINFPLSFAPSLDYKGFEDIRFAPGWADTTAKDYFTYTFTWVLDKNPRLDQEKLETQMKAYFDGLMAAVSERDDLPKTQASFELAKAKSAFGAIGEITFYDAFFKKDLVTLQVLVFAKPCPKAKKYLVRFDLSPKGEKDPVWASFRDVKYKLDCEK